MKVALAYHSGDAAQAQRLADWLVELGPQPNHDLLLLRNQDAPAIEQFRRVFRKVEEIVIADDTWNKWPDSACWAFRKAAKNVEYTTREPWFWIEPDVAVFRQSAFDEFAAEYGRARAAGKHFLGALKATNDTPPVPKMSGIGCYPGNMSEMAGTVFQAFDVPWDVLAAGEIVPNMQKSELLRDIWKSVPFTSWAEVEEKILSRCPRCAIFHSDKTGSLIPLLRAKRNGGDVKCDHIEANRESGISMNSDATVRSEAAATSEPEAVAEIRTLTLPDIAGCYVKTSAEGAVSYAKAIQVDQTPWENKAESIAEIRKLAERLHAFQDNASHVRSVRVLLHEAKVIELAYRFKRRKKWRKKK